MKSKKTTPRKHASLAARAFHDAMRDILATEGWFEVTVAAPEPPAAFRWMDEVVATA